MKKSVVCCMVMWPCVQLVGLQVMQVCVLSLLILSAMLPCRFLVRRADVSPALLAPSCVALLLLGRPALCG